MPDIKRAASYTLETRVIHCEKHGYVEGTAFTSPLASFETCPLCEKETGEQEARAAKEKAAQNRAERYKACGVEPEYYDKDFADFVAQTPTQKQALDAVKKLIAGDIDKVVLLGGNGAGKTMLASLAVKALGGRILSMYELSLLIRSAFAEGKSERQILEELACAPFLAIDELDKNKQSDAAAGWTSYLVDKRHTRRLPLLIATNAHLARDCAKGGCADCFESRVGNDVLSRLQERSVVIAINAPSWRAKGNNRS